MAKIKSSFLYKEIHEQPDVLARLLTGEEATLKSLASAIQDRGINHIMIAARGTSDNAARYAKYLLGAVNRLPVSLATPSLFTIYNQPPLFKDTFVLGISQSGKSPDIVAVISEARRQGALTAAFTNFPGSDLGSAAEFTVDLCAGLERSLAATKTYTSELGAIALLSVSLSGEEDMASALAKIPVAVRHTLAMDDEIREIAQRYRYMNACVVIGRGYNYATAFELALKMKELTYTIVEPYSSADFLHGPLAMIDHGFPVIVLAPSGAMVPELKDFIHKIIERQAEVIAISDEPEILGLSRIPLALPVSVPEWLSPITAIIPGQLFAMHLANVRDFDVDHPRALRKVTETL